MTLLEAIKELYELAEDRIHHGWVSSKTSDLANTLPDLNDRFGLRLFGIGLAAGLDIASHRANSLRKTETEATYDALENTPAARAAVIVARRQAHTKWIKGAQK